MSKKTQLDYSSRHQKGVALVISMVLLIVCLLLGVSSMQSSLLDERLAGNHRASVLARMAAEAGIADFKNNNIYEQIKSDFLKNNGEFQDIEEEKPFRPGAEGSADGKGYYEVVYKRNSNGNLVLKSTGSYGRATRVVMAVIRKNPTPVSAGGMVTCMGASFTGGQGSVFDRFDSRNGPYGENGNSTAGTNLVALLKSSKINMDMGVAATFKGSIITAGDLAVSNTQPILGDVYASGDITLKGDNALITGNVKSEGMVVFEVGTRVDGTVSANEKVAIYGNWGVVTPYEGDGAQRSSTSSAVGGDVVSDNIFIGLENNDKKKTSEEEVNDAEEIYDRVEGGLIRNNPGHSFPTNKLGGLKPVSKEEDCPTYGIEALWGQYEDTSKKGNVNIGHYEMKELSWHLGGGAGYSRMNGIDVFHVRDFNVGGIGFTIDEPTIIVADGDVNFGHYGDIEITNGAFLKIITEGKFSAKGGTITAASEKPLTEFNGEVEPTFSVYSAYGEKNSDKGVAVSVSGVYNLYGKIVAPYSTVALGGSGKIFGAIKAGYLKIDGGASVHFDEAFEQLSENNEENGDKGNGSEGVSDSDFIFYCFSADYTKDCISDI